MRRLGMLAAITGVVSVLGGGLIAAPALARGPTVTRFHVEGTFIDRHTCDFNIRGSFVDRGQEISFMENSSTDTFVFRIHDNFTVTFTNLATGTSIREDEHFNIYVNVHHGSGEVTYTGLPLRFIPAPGGHFIIRDAGKVVFDAETGDIIFEGGPHPFLHLAPGEFVALFCGALS